MWRVPATRSAAKRLLLGRAFSTENLVRERLPKRLALPALSSDSLSSVAYAPDQILLALTVGGASLMLISPWVALAVVTVLIVVVVAMRINIREYPHGGGDYAVVRENLGPAAGRIAGSSLLLDYVLTVAVSLSQAGAFFTSVDSRLGGFEAVIALALLTVLTVVSLRGVRDSGRFLAAPVYLFIGALSVMLLVGAVQAAMGVLQPAASAGTVTDNLGDNALTATGAALLIARAFAGGSAALTGVEAISNAVPSFRPPKARNAQLTLTLMASIAAAMLLGVVLLARGTGVVMRPPTEGVPGFFDNRAAEPVISQIADAVYGSGSLLALITILATAVVLCLAANTAFQSFPELASALARDGFLPRQLRLRGDRLAFSNGILLLAGLAALAILLSRGHVTTLVHMYVVGVFISMALAQRGMIRHCTRRIRVETRGQRRRVLARHRAVAATAFVVICLVLLVVLAGKLAYGGWLAVLVIGAMAVLMTAIDRHYRQVAAELELAGPWERVPMPEPAQPDRSHAVVLVARLDRAALHTLAVALAARHLSVQAVAVADGENDTAAMVRAWRRHEVPVPLRLVYAPYRDLQRPVRAVIQMLHARNPHEPIVVYLPEIEVRHWWQWVLHNHSSRGLSKLLSGFSDVRVVTVAWRLGSGARTRRQDLTAEQPESTTRAEVEGHASVPG